MHILSYTGSYVQRLGHTGTCPGCFQTAMGVAVYSETGYLIVTDYFNHNVQIFISNSITKFWSGWMVVAYGVADITTDCPYIIMRRG